MSEYASDSAESFYTFKNCDRFGGTPPKNRHSIRQPSDFLYKAEVCYKASEQGIEDQLRPGVKKRMRESTPPDELGSENERRFQREESEEWRRANEEDRDWGGN